MWATKELDFQELHSKEKFELNLNVCRFEKEELDVYANNGTFYVKGEKISRLDVKLILDKFSFMNYPKQFVWIRGLVMWNMGS